MRWGQPDKEASEVRLEVHAAGHDQPGSGYEEELPQRATTGAEAVAAEIDLE